MNSTLLRFSSECELGRWIGERGGGEAGGGGGGEGGDGDAVCRQPGAPERSGVDGGLSARFVLAAWVSDQYGQYGLVGCALCHVQPSQPPQQADPPRPHRAKQACPEATRTEAGEAEAGCAEALLVLECLNMSCRVLDRGVEVELLRRVGSEARR